MKSVLRLVIFLILSLLIVSSGAAQSINELPMYGEKPKSPEVLKADQKFIKEATEKAGSREKAAEIAIRRGWQYIEQHDPKMAIRRLNQAWLLTPNNGHVYWGFAAAVGQQGNLDESIRFFDKAITLLPNNARLICDFGFTYIWKGQSVNKSPTDADIYYSRAISFFKNASTIEPKYERIYSNWAIVLFLKQDYKGAWQKVKQAESLGGKTIDKTFVDDLSRKMKRP
jgi:tetratricopeptide (TPR) repeat protein